MKSFVFDLIWCKVWNECEIVVQKTLVQMVIRDKCVQKLGFREILVLKRQNSKQLSNGLLMSAQLA